MPQLSIRPARCWAAFIACVLLINALVSAWTLALAVGAPTQDAFGNPLCITSSDAGSHDNSQNAVPNCCTLGCAIGAAALEPPGQAFYAYILPSNPSDISWRTTENSNVPAPWYGPGIPRAPPLRT